MARPLRIEIPGAWYHVTARGNERRPIFRGDRDLARFIELLEEMVERYRVRLHGYVLMTNHYHLIVETPGGNLSRAMQWLNVSYSTWFNRRHRRSGHLFQGRFKAIIVDPKEWGLALSRYVHLNPLRTREHGLSKAQRQEAETGRRKAATKKEIESRLMALNSYRWSSYRAFAGFEPEPAWLETAGVAGLTGGNEGGWRRKYRALVEEGAREGASSPWPALEAQLVLGNRTLLEDVRGQLKGGKREHPGKRAFKRRRSFEEVVSAVARHRGEAWEDFSQRRGDPGREMVWWLARRHCGLTLRELGQRAGAADYAAVGMALSRFEARKRWGHISTNNKKVDFSCGFGIQSRMARPLRIEIPGAWYRTPSLPGACPDSGHPRCGGRKSKFLARASKHSEVGSQTRNC
jgi:REP element-mobilizing transposase RayT